MRPIFNIQDRRRKVQLMLYIGNLAQTSLLHTALIYETHFQHTRSAKESARLYMGTDQTCFVDMFSGDVSDYQLLLEQVRKILSPKDYFLFKVFSSTVSVFLAVKPPALNDKDCTPNIFTPVHYPRLSMNFQLLITTLMLNKEVTYFKSLRWCIYHATKF